jgi:hypothetical protein
MSTKAAPIPLRMYPRIICTLVLQVEIYSHQGPVQCVAFFFLFSFRHKTIKDIQCVALLY